MTLPKTSTPAAETAPRSLFQRRSKTLVRTIVTFAVVIVIVLIAQRFLSGANPILPSGWSSQTFTISPAPTADQSDEAGTALVAELAHLGTSTGQAAVKGAKVAVGTPEPDPALAALAHRRFTPSVALRPLVSSAPNGQQPQTGAGCDTKPGGDEVCSSDRAVIGTFGGAVLTGLDITNASSTVDPTTQKGTVTVTFTPAGQTKFANAVHASGGHDLIFVLTMDSTESWALTPLQVGQGVDGTGKITNLTGATSDQLAAILRLTRQPMVLTD